MSRRKVTVDWPRTIAGALAAVVAAILLSKLGAAGTLIGAALGSIVISLGTTIGSHGLQTTHERLLEAQLRSRSAPEDPTQVLLVQEDSAQVLPAVDEGEEKPRRRWGRVVAFGVASFVLAIALITGFELITGRPLSAYTGGGGKGTTLSDIGGGSSTKSTPKPPPSPSVTDTATSTPTTSTSPMATATATATSSTSATPSASATETATTTSSATASPTDSATDSPNVPTSSPTP